MGTQRNLLPTGVSIVYNNKPIGRCVMDFVVGGKIVLELKVVARLGYTHN